MEDNQQLIWKTEDLSRKFMCRIAAAKLKKKWKDTSTEWIARKIEVEDFSKAANLLNTVNKLKIHSSIKNPIQINQNNSGDLKSVGKDFISLNDNSTFKELQNITLKVKKPKICTQEVTKITKENGQIISNILNNDRYARNNLNSVQQNLFHNSKC